MRIKSKSNSAQAIPYVSKEFIFCCAASVVGYTALVPVLALESMFLAESLMQFGALNQMVMLLLIILKSLTTLGQIVTSGWKNHYLITLSAVGLLLISAQPAAPCCTTLVVAIAGMLPWSEVSPLDAIEHLMPVVACTLIMIDPLIADGKLTRWSLPPQRSN